MATKQVDPSQGRHLFTLVNGQKYELTPSELGLLFASEDDVARLIFEGTEESDLGCRDDPEQCYLEVAYETDDAVLTSARVYLDLHPVTRWYDHYTVGRNTDGELNSDSAPTTVQLASELIDPVETLDPDNYILFVHGWRMREWERLAFAETMFKRLYWSGYRGRFGVFTWPTLYFEKPAHEYGYEAVWRVLRNLHNYDESEVIARRSGERLVSLVRSLSSQGPNSNSQVHLVAHSLGNVVVSEALRLLGSEVQRIKSYVTSQGAVDAGSYNADLDDMQHRIFGLPLVGLGPGCSGIVTAEQAWSCYTQRLLELVQALAAAVGQVSWLAEAYEAPTLMPPDRHRYRAEPVHPRARIWYPAGRPADPFVDPLDPDSAHVDWRAAYFTRAHNWLSDLRFINFYNPADQALRGWQLNQLTKPDEGLIPGVVRFDYEPEDVTEGEYDFCDLATPPLPSGDRSCVRDSFSEGAMPLTWVETATASESTWKILAHILPGRTLPLGQMPVDVSSNDHDLLSKDGFNASNQDHSGQFHSTYAKRIEYWRSLVWVQEGGLEIVQPAATPPP